MATNSPSGQNREKAPAVPGADKAALRRIMLKRRAALSAEERHSRSLAAQRHILDEALWQKASCVALYMAVRGEADTAALLERAWAEGKSVLLPLCSRQEKGRMDFCPCAGRQALRPGLYGIPEPDPDLARPSAPLTPDLLVVPGLAFDRQGFRLGLGGGYYDRFFLRSPWPGVARLGLAFSFQILDALPREAWDRPVHALGTEDGLLWIKRP
ncbi:MAG: 5-formyltetrahydrofolate cyclo-ligase [Deltaproteobacteria bacterium]|jgi:5-formyltetrahydrofolate cyclo-ligase|nr:5-formyltetrahydrofolate cyclo-ligase [Deltaproteobacteria bacterium]